MEQLHIKKIIITSLTICLLILCLTACGSDTQNTDEASNRTDNNITSENDGLTKKNSVNTPTQDYLISCLEATPNIIGVAAVTKENDPNGELGTEDGYYAAVFFSVDLVDQDGLYGDDLINRGTDAGGCIEAYTTEEAAIARNEYLAKYDDNWLLNAGCHTTIGTLVVRTSKELSEADQEQLESNIIAALTGGEIGEAIAITSQENDNDSEAESSPTESGKNDKPSQKIVMPNSTTDYIGSEWTIETITKHFQELGFTNIRAIPCEPDDDNYKVNIREMVIKTGLFSTNPWKAGDEFAPDTEISIYYNEFPLLTIENCPDLVTVLTSKDIDYTTFCNTYDGRYVEFEAYVTNHITYDGGTSHIIDVTGGDYDGVSELGHYDEEYYKGLVIRIGDRTWGNNIDKSVEEGQNVTVSGKIDASWCEYYKQLYVECQDLSKR